MADDKKNPMTELVDIVGGLPKDDQGNVTISKELAGMYTH
jgi:hypothetical protein